MVVEVEVEMVVVMVVEMVVDEGGVRCIDGPTFTQPCHSRLKLGKVAKNQPTEQPNNKIQPTEQNMNQKNNRTIELIQLSTTKDQTIGFS